MGNAQRKARKRAGEKFQHPTKVPTPREERTSQKVASSKMARRIMRQVAARNTKLP